MRIRVTQSEGEARPTNAKILESVAKALGEPKPVWPHEHEEESAMRAIRELGAQADAIWDEEIDVLTAQIQALFQEP